MYQCIPCFSAFMICFSKQVLEFPVFGIDTVRSAKFLAKVLLCVKLQVLYKPLLLVY